MYLSSPLLFAAIMKSFTSDSDWQLCRHAPLPGNNLFTRMEWRHAEPAGSFGQSAQARSGPLKSRATASPRVVSLRKPESGGKEALKQQSTYIVKAQSLWKTSIGRYICVRRGRQVVICWGETLQGESCFVRSRWRSSSGLFVYHSRRMRSGRGEGVRRSRWRRPVECGVCER